MRGPWPIPPRATGPKQAKVPPQVEVRKGSPPHLGMDRVPITVQTMRAVAR